MISDQAHLPASAELISGVIRLAEAASGRILEIYNSEFSITHKDDRSPLTAADLASHDTICKGLHELTPSIPILSEESANIPFAVRKNWDYFWLVDPLDGTREFIKRNGEFTINIALIEKHTPILGVIHVPVAGITYYASRGNGACKKSGNEPPRKISTRRTDAGHIALAGSCSHGSDRQQALINRLGNIEIHAIGSALKFCLVAEGIVDIYPRFGPTSEWDTAAAQCLVEEAGGTVTDMAFNPLRYNTRETVLNPDFLVIADKTFNWRSYLAGL